MAEQRQVPLPGLEGPAPVPSGPARQGFKLRVFGSHEFFRLWLTQVASATGDWLGFFALAVLAANIAEQNPAAGVGFVMTARVAPGFFLGPAAGVLADRFDRKRMMVFCDLGRAAVLLTLPFVDTILGLVLASFLLECFTLLWTPAKEASVPHLVPADHLTTANSLSMVAAYGTLPLAAAIFSVLAGLSDAIGRIDALDVFRTNKEGIAFYVDACTFFLSAFMISRLSLPKNDRVRERGRIDLGSAFHELKEGWSFIFINPVVRAVNVGLATGLIGGGMLVPLGPVFAKEVLGADPSEGFGLMVFALGTGVAIGVVILSVFQRLIPKAQVFAGSVFVAGASLLLAASMSALGPASLFVAVMGVCAGSVYVLGFTLLHESVDDELRGRIFSALYTLVRLCVLIAFAVGPFLSGFLDEVSEQLVGGTIDIGGVEIAVPGVRLTLWLAGFIIMGAGVLATMSLRAGWRHPRAASAPSPLDELLYQEGAEVLQGFASPIAEVKRSFDDSRPPREGPEPRLIPAPDPESPPDRPDPEP